MHVDIVHLPSELAAIDLTRRTAVVFDVLRATTSMTTALANGAREVRAFKTLDEAQAAHAAFADGPKLLAGERRTVKPPGFDLGNSPAEYTSDRVAGRTLFFATTNGTVAVRACESAQRTFVASLCNASAMARHLSLLGDDVVMVCSGTEGVAGADDISGGATVADLLRRLRPDVTLSDRLQADVAGTAATTRDPSGLSTLLHATPGAANLARAGLAGDVDWVAASYDRFDVVAEVEHRQRFAIVTKWVSPRPQTIG